MSYVLGIDPGFGGALSWTDGDVVWLFDMPTLKRGAKTEIDTCALAELIEKRADQTSYCVLENVHAMPKDGVASSFRFGQGFGTLIGILAANKIKTIRVEPAVWKANMRLSSKKEDSLKKARELWPYRAKEFSLKKHDGRAEAALLAYHGLDVFGG